jgi:hypothetical protein
MPDTPSPTAPQPTMMPAYPPPYGYPYTLPQPLPERPVPVGRIVPTAWLVMLVVATLAAVVMALGGALAAEVGPSPFHTVVYSNSLASSDGAWQLRDTPTETCSYAHGGLDARDATSDLLVNPCQLSRSDISNMRLSVRILPQTQLDFLLRPVLFVHTSIAISFSPTTGSFAVYAPSPGATVSNTSPVNVDLIYSGSSDQWFTDGSLSNTVIVQAQDGIYTIAVNGAQIYQGDFNGATNLPPSGSVALGAWLSSSDASTTGEAAYADFTLSTP